MSPFLLREDSSILLREDSSDYLRENMTFVAADRVQETTTTTGTGTLTLAGATAQHQSFAAIGNGNTCGYVITDANGTAWEVGIGTYTFSGTTLARTTVLGSSNSGSAINLSSGTHTVSNVFPARDGLPDRWTNLKNPELSITSAGAATLNRGHIVSGSTAFTVTLPASSGNAGAWVGIRITSTNIITIKGNASENIDGVNTRVMWLGEACELICDGTGWYKVSGKTIPMYTTLSRVTDQSLTTNTWTPVAMTAQVEGTVQMYDSGNSRISIQRTGKYWGVAQGYLTGLTVLGSIALVSNSSGSSISGAGAQIPQVGAALQATFTMNPITLTAGSGYVNGYAYGDNNSAVVKGSVIAFLTSVVEIPSW